MRRIVKQFTDIWFFWLAVAITLGVLSMPPWKSAESYVSYHRHPGQNGYSDTVHAHEGGNISHRH